MPYLIDQLTLLHRQLKAMEEEQKSVINALDLGNDIQAIDDAFKSAFEAYENADDPDELEGDSWDKHCAFEARVKREG